MNDTFYKVMEKRFGTAFPVDRTQVYWVVENIGFSDPKRPSWFVCQTGLPNGDRFKSREEAEEFGMDWHKRMGIPYRITEVLHVEKYTYVGIGNEQKTTTEESQNS